MEKFLEEITPSVRLNWAFDVMGVRWMAGAGYQGLMSGSGLLRDGVGHCSKSSF